MGVVLGVLAGIGSAKDFSLLEREKLEVFEIKKSTLYQATSEEFNGFIDNSNWLEFESQMWQRIRQEKEDGSYDNMRGYTAPQQEVIASTGTVHDELPQVEVDLPYQARLSISGRKSISVKYGYVHEFGDENERTVAGTSGATRGFEMEQELRVRIKGKVGEKITVNVDYDDTKPAYDESARKISVIYKGDPDEIIQEAAFGDINLSIPSTQFVGYSKNVFGASVKGRYDKLKFMAIGSQTKGKTDIKEFTGQTTFTKKDINDTAYTRRKYYNIDLGTTSSHLPIDVGSVNIYIDDKDISNFEENNESTMTVTFWGSTQTYTGSFYELVPGKDFFVDYQEGIVTFNKYVGSEYVIAVEYRYNNGATEVGYSGSDPVVIKDENESLSYELKNRYNLGATKILREDFVIKFLDLNRNQITLPEGSYNIDYELGILEFTDDTPFYCSSPANGYQDIYNNTSPQHHYIIYVEYEQRIKSYYLRPNIIRGSERVLMNGQVLSRDGDYIIDYPSGFLTFLDPERIDETTKIEVTYEYMPFGGMFKETLVGLRGEYNFSSNFFMGGTMLYSQASAPLEIPQIHSTPESTLVLDSDFNLKIPSTKYFPLPTSINGEVARSIYNPNTVGKAMIDNMEGVRQSFSVSTDMDSWKIAATPSGTPANPNWMVLDEDDIYLSEINTNVSGIDDEKRKILLMNYSLPSTWSGSGDPERSIVYTLSKTGMDLSDKDAIQMWIKGDGRYAELQIDFGSISEDADSTGELKTEDINNNGTLDRGEDIGWKYEYSGSTYSIGAVNGRVDTNDLDGDGFLDKIQNYQSFDSAVDSNLYINWSGWKKITIPRGGADSDWSAVKHVRVTVKGANISGTICIASIEAVGNRWEVGLGTETLTLNAVNNYDNDDYVTPLNEAIYEKIYEQVGGSNLEKEQALELNYTGLSSGATAYAYLKYPQAVDFSKHGKINFLLYQKEGADVDFFISFGAGTNFYTRTIKAASLGSGTWKKFSFRIPEDFQEAGSPGLSNIVEVRVGIVNNSGSQKTGRIWVNEVYLEDPAKRVGQALRGSFSSSIPRVLNFGGSYQTKDRDFQTITTPPANQDSTSYSVNANLIAISFLPLSGSYSESEVITPAERITPSQRNPYLREEDTGKVINRSGNIDAKLSLRKFPALSGNYSQSVSDSNFTGKTEITRNYKGSGSYGIPGKLFFIPRTVSGSYRKTDAFIYWKEYRRDENPLGGFEDRMEETIDYSATADMSMFNALSLKPSYSKNEKWRTWDFYTGQFSSIDPRWKWSQSQNVALSGQLSILNWLRPSSAYSINVTEDYNYIAQNSVSVQAGTKNVGRNFKLTSSVALPAKKILPWFEPVDTLTLNTNYSTEKGETYKNVENDYDVFAISRLDQSVLLHPSTPTARLETLTGRYSWNYTANWSPFKFLNLEQGIMNLIGGISARSNYNYIKSRSETTGTVLDTITEIWPDFDITYGRLEKLPFTGSHVSNVSLRSNYSFKQDKTISNDEGVDRNIQTKYGANCRFLLLEEYDSFVEFSRQWDKKIDLREKHWETYYNSITYTGQIKFKLKKYWNLMVRYSQAKSKKESYRSVTPMSDSRVYKPGLSFDAIIDMPSTFKLPLIGKEISMVNRLKLVSSLDAEFSRSELNVDKTNTNRYNANISAEMDVASNMRFTFGFGAEYLKNLEVPENGHFAFNIRSDMVIRF